MNPEGSLVVLLALFAAGVLHGLGPDHLAAIAALVGRGAESGGGRRRELAWLGLRFGMGHVTTLVLLAVVLWTLGRSLSDRWQAGLEQMGGAVLIFLGGWMLASVVRRKVIAHTHPHRHTHSTADHEHVHVHLSGRPHDAHSHPHLATLVGGLLGFSGARALLVALPLVMAGSAGAVLTRVLAFGAGIVVSMTLAGWVAGAAFAGVARRPAYVRLVVGATGVLSAALGLYWLAGFASG
jgi:ABC-type nickel/cobalt efflux system permease component RcnA